jgi:uncharacterized protein (DUF4213/DUF364 family)
MGLIEDVLDEIDDKPIDDVRIGKAFVGVRIGGRIGVAHRVDEKVENTKKNVIFENTDKMNFKMSIHESENAKIKGFIGKKILELIYSEDNLECAIATAAINAQINLENYHTGNIFKMIMDIAKNYDRIGIIGKFPIVNKLIALDKTIYAFEKKPIPGFLPANKADELLPECDLVIITGTTFVNKSLEHLLELCHGYTMLIGPTTPMAKSLFNYNINILAGIICLDEGILDIIANGGGTKEFKKFIETIYIEKN